MPSHPTLTVLVCTFNRAELLAECLRSLTCQTAAPSDFRVIVVDNNSTDNTRNVVEDLTKEHAGFTWHFEPEQGLSHARNTGLKVADTDWCAFLDDDAVAHDNWVARILDTIATTDFDAFGGVYLPWYRDGRVVWYLDRYASNKARMPAGGRTLLRHACFSGGNAAFLRKAAIGCGGFPTGIGMIGTTLGYGEESALQHEMRAHGYRIGFDPDMLIDHLVPRHKQTLDWFRRRAVAEGRSELERNPRGIEATGPLKLSLGYLVQDVKRTAGAIVHFLRGRYRKENLYIDVVPPLLYQREVLRSLFARRRGIGDG